MSRLTRSRHPAYHLRPNKAVDRLVFLDILKALKLFCSLDNHVYIGFGGPFLEDFRMMAQEFPELRMISIEEDGETHKRQLFHKCSRRLDVLPCKFEEFLANGFPTGNATITWVDYTSMDRQCLLEISDLTRKAVSLSVLRVTVKAETPVRKKLRLFRPKLPVDLPPGRHEEFESFVKEHKAVMSVDGITYSDEVFVWKRFREDSDGYPYLLNHLITKTIISSCNYPKRFLPLHAVTYSDGTMMLSVTGIFCEEEDIEKLRDHFQKECNLLASDSDDVDLIDVPTLTTRERLYLESVLPVANATGEVSLRKLKYLVEGDGKQRESKYKMQQYEKYHRLYPYFGKLVP